MNSIKKRLVLSFLLIIVITVFSLGTLLTIIIRQSYYQNIEDNLQNQIKVSSQLYTEYFSHNTLQDNILNNVGTFWEQTEAQVQIVDSNKNILMDSIGVDPEMSKDMPDVDNALDGHYDMWMGDVDYYLQPVMSVSYPLISEGEIVGAIRLTTSLEVVNSEVAAIRNLFIIIGLIVVAISSLVSLLLANTIVKPLEAVTSAAHKMAMGNFNAKSPQKTDDEIGKLSNTLNFMAEEIQKREQLKNHFISSVSHELRTPLTSIKGWAITLKNGHDDSSLLLEGLQTIENESDRLKQMVEELLDFSKLISEGITLKPQPLEINNLFEELKREFEPISKEKNIKLTIDTSNSYPTLILDKNKLKQVLINLLDNSFKFSQPKSTIKVSTQLKDKKIHFKIKDYGSGIAAEDLPHVKERFYKGKSSKSSSGLGLSISQEIITAMDGELKIKSKQGIGTEITIYIPAYEVKK
ncbi:HAMP domain-containing sensor histidine kinase [Proteinivorax tanatarense]|uniref:histidine kinase n=1 Tax=Proteinivorax tanatarense TaxID=1260629 RepID=A0AAU7VMM5_9FIRM